MTTPVPAPAPADFPGKTLGIVGLIVVFFSSLIGLIISGVALKQSKDAGFANTPAKVGLILGIIFTALGLLFAILWFGVFGAIAVSSSSY